jgi:hypothetical protein
MITLRFYFLLCYNASAGERYLHDRKDQGTVVEDSQR